MMSIPGWQFDTIYGRETDVSNPLIEYFEGDYNYFLAREVLQNSLDAWDEDSGKPVKVKFSLEYFSRDDFPGYKEFLEILKSAKKFWPPEKEKCHSFLNDALYCISQDRVPVLKISDYNTIGLNGEDHDRNSPWYGLVKSVGSTTKHSGQGGSFGIGKGAPFASSFLRTVFYSTKNKTGQNVFQGVSELVSHTDSAGNTKSGAGSYSINRQNSIRDASLINEKMIRQERGLDIFVMGYKKEDNWQQKLMESVLRNFWPAIQEKLLEVQIDGVNVNYSNLEQLLVKYFIDKPYKDSAKPRGNPLQFFRAYKEGRIFEEDLKTLGPSKFYFNRTEEPLNMVAMIRKSKMVIYSSRFNWHAPYAGVFICDNEIGNRELRKMESPQHDEWDKNRNKEKGNRIDRELREFVRGVLRKLSKVDRGGVVDIPELYKYLPFDEEVKYGGNGQPGGEYTGNTEKEETGGEIEKEEDIKDFISQKQQRVTVLNSPAKGMGEDGNIEREGKKKKKSKKKAPGGGTGDAKANITSKINTRIFLTENKGNIREYMLVIRSDIKCRANFKLVAVGEEGVIKVELIEVTGENGHVYKTSKNKIKNVKLKEKGQIKLRAKVHSRIKLSLKLEGYVVQ